MFNGAYTEAAKTTADTVVGDAYRIRHFYLYLHIEIYNTLLVFSGQKTRTGSERIIRGLGANATQ